MCKGEEIMKCPNCDQELTEGKSFCSGCGKKVEVTSKIPEVKPKHCMDCGAVLDAGKKFCASCGASIEGEIGTKEANGKKGRKHKKEKKKKSLPMKVLSGFGWFMVFMFVIAMFSDGESTSNQIVVPVSEIATYKNSCNSYTYETIFRDSEQYRGQKAVFTGKVIQTMYGNNRVDMRVNVTAKEYEYIDDVSYSDTMYVTYYPSSAESRILEDDIITIYGELAGVYSYESVMGGKITIPKINVAILERGAVASKSESQAEGTSSEEQSTVEDDGVSETQPSVSEEIPSSQQPTPSEVVEEDTQPAQGIIHSEAEVMELYKGKLAEYQLGEDNHWNDTQYYEAGLAPIMPYYGSPYCYVAFADFDGNGVKEMILAGDVGENSYAVLAIYTITTENGYPEAKNLISCHIESWLEIGDGMQIITYRELVANETQKTYYQVRGENLVEFDGNLPSSWYPDFFDFEPMTNYLVMER